VSVAWVSGLWRWVSVAAVASLAVTATAVVITLIAADRAGSAGRELSQGLLPATAASAVLLAQYLDQQTVLRNYVTSGQPDALRQYQKLGTEIREQQERLASLVRAYPHIPGELAAASLAWRVWEARIVGPQLRATAHGDFATARALQANIVATRPYTLAIRLPVAALQEQLASLQTSVTTRLISAQADMTTALAALCVMAAVMAVGGVVTVRRWLLAPFAILRAAAESVAAGEFDTRIPSVGPAELADLGHSIELMRTRLAAALTDAQRAEERFRGLFHSSPDATLTVAADGSIVMVNAQAERMFGYSFGELAGRPVEMLVPAAVRAAHPGKRAAYFADPRFRPMGEGQELSAVRKDGQEFRVEISLGSLPSETGVVASATIRDISDRVAAQAEEERVRAAVERERIERRLQIVAEAEMRKLNEDLEVRVRERTADIEASTRELDAFAYSVSHDLRAPLRSLSGFSQALLEDFADVLDDTGKSYLHRIRHNVQNMGQMIDSLLNLSRATRAELNRRAIDLSALAGEIAAELSVADPGQDVTMEIAENLRCTGDPQLLRLVLRNLLGNARKFSAKTPRARIDVGQVDIDGEGVFFVRDNGAGFDMRYASKLFNAFQRLHSAVDFEGTGVGLATVQRIVSRHGGRIYAEAEPGQGATFYFTLQPATGGTR
jgi:PAS domain S-box-containing protein